MSSVPLFRRAWQFAYELVQNANKSRKDTAITEHSCDEDSTFKTNGRHYGGGDDDPLDVGCREQPEQFQQSALFPFVICSNSSGAKFTEKQLRALQIRERANQNPYKKPLADRETPTQTGFSSVAVQKPLADRGTPTQTGFSSPSTQSTHYFSDSDSLDISHMVTADKEIDISKADEKQSAFSYAEVVKRVSEDDSDDDHLADPKGTKLVTNHTIQCLARRLRVHHEAFLAIEKCLASKDAEIADLKRQLEHRKVASVASVAPPAKKPKPAIASDAKHRNGRRCPRCWRPYRDARWKQYHQGGGCSNEDDKTPDYDATKQKPIKWNKYTSMEN